MFGGKVSVTCTLDGVSMEIVEVKIIRTFRNEKYTPSVRKAL